MRYIGLFLLCLAVLLALCATMIEFQKGREASFWIFIGAFGSAGLGICLGAVAKRGSEGK